MGRPLWDSEIAINRTGVYECYQPFTSGVRVPKLPVRSCCADAVRLIALNLGHRVASFSIHAVVIAVYCHFMRSFFPSEVLRGLRDISHVLLVSTDMSTYIYQYMYIYIYIYIAS